MNDLQKMRRRIEEIDGEILGLVARRMRIAKSIGEAKRELGVPLRDWEVERRVLERAELAAGELDIAPDVAKDIMRTLMGASRAEQERYHCSSYEGSAEHIAVVGGGGRMGQWLVRFFGDQGHRVSIHDVDRSETASSVAPDLGDAVREASFVAIATTLEAVPGVIDQLADMRYEGTMFDIASLKGHLKPAITRARERGLSITSLHPMFGPDTRMLADKVICVCDCGDDEATRRIEAFLRPTAATLVPMSIDEHDEIVSYVLGLSHLVNIVFAKVLVDSGLSYDRLRNMESTTFLSQMRTTTSVICENPKLYYDIQRCNPRSAELYQRFEGALRAVTEWVTGGRGAEFECFMNAGKQWVQSDDAR